MNRQLKNMIILMLDAYKLFHRQMYPNNTILVYSNATPRGGKHRGKRNQEYVISFGMQRLVKKMYDEFQEFFNTDWDILEPFLKDQLNSFTGSEYSIEHLKSLHSLGYIPMVVKALPEGLKCPYGVPYMTMYNTKPEFFWLTNYLETWMSAEQWNCITAATTAHQYRQIFEKWALKTTGNTNNVAIQGHDFSMRGHNGSEAASIAGLGHLTSFVGTDTVPAYLDAQYYYNTGTNNWNDLTTKGWMQSIVGTSVPATEHSVQCAHYNGEDELEYLDHILETFPTGIVSIVCDGFDFWKFITEILPQRKKEILARDGKLVVRPDSGDPADIICGRLYTNDEFTAEDENILLKINEDYYCEVYNDANYPDGYELKHDDKIWSENEQKGAIQCLWDIFGGTTNKEGYIELNSHIGLIYGDSITLDRAEDICKRLEAKGFASTNWIAGIGSYTYQMVTRDTDGQAFKATYVELSNPRNPKRDDGFETIGKPIYKDPKTGDGSKKSAKGLISVENNLMQDKLFLLDERSWKEEKISHLREIFKDGKLLNQETLFDIRKRLNNE